MNFLRNLLDNREIAIAVWLIILFIWSIFHKNIRKSILAIFKTFTTRVIFIPALLMLLYIGLMVYCFSAFGLWDISNLSDTIVWFVGAAFAMFINIGYIKERDYFRKVILDNLKIVVFIEFITNLYVFDLWVELILVPVFAMIGGRGAGCCVSKC